jgi:hypothetical protein
VLNWLAAAFLSSAANPAAGLDSRISKKLVRISANELLLACSLTTNYVVARGFTTITVAGTALPLASTSPGLICCESLNGVFVRSM